MKLVFKDQVEHALELHARRARLVKRLELCLERLNKIVSAMTTKELITYMKRASVIENEIRTKH